VHRVVAAALIDDGRVLLGHRSVGRERYPAVWDLPGGHIEVGETAERSLVRELMEEIGVTVEEAAVEPIVELEVPTGEVRLTLYRVWRWSGQPFIACPAEHDRIGWFALPDLHLLDLAHPAYLEILRPLMT
jgi:8-oxo-dGTP diphosphatase